MRKQPVTGRPADEINMANAGRRPGKIFHISRCRLELSVSLYLSKSYTLGGRK
jgi:hypothetical protein